MGEREIQQPRRFFGVVEEELVEIAEPKKEQCVSRNGRAQPLVLLHHGGERVLHRDNLIRKTGTGERDFRAKMSSCEGSSEEVGAATEFQPSNNFF